MLAVVNAGASGSEFAALTFADAAVADPVLFFCVSPSAELVD